VNDPRSDAGVLSEEATKLVAAAQAWFRRVAGEASAPKIATGSPECELCPLCQLIALLRTQGPEMTARLGEAQAALVALWRAVAETASAETASAESSSSSESAAAAQPSPETGSNGTGRVHRITLDGSDA